MFDYVKILETGYCRECNKTVSVANTEPLEPSLWDKVTGFHVFVMDDDYEDHWKGYMCKECIDKLLHTPKISMIGGGSMLPEIHLEKEYFKR